MKSYDYTHRKGVHPISWDNFQDLCKLLVEKISDYHFDIILGIARGGLYPATLIAGMLQVEFYPLRITRRENDRVLFEKPIWKIDVTDAVKDKNVLIVDEIADTGETLQLVKERAAQKGAARTSCMTLVTHSWSNPKPDYFAFESDELIIFPWDTQIWVDQAWQLHPELREALRAQEANN